MRSRKLREADNVSKAFEELDVEAYLHQVAPDSEERAKALLEAFENFVALVRGEIARQTKLEERP